MKKTLVVILVVMMMAFVFAGCGTKTEPAETPPADSEETATPAADTETSPAADDQSTEAEITIRFADVQAETDTETLAALEFSRLVGEKSNGRIDVQVFPNGQLGDMKDIMQSVQMGAVEMCRNNPGWLADAGAPRLNVLSLPFLFSSLDHANAVIEGEIGKDLLSDLQTNGLGLVGLGYLQPSARYFFFTDKAVDSLDDMKGLKLRVPTNEMNADMVEAFGASATPVAYNELYSALQTGLVDGAENPLKGFTNMAFSDVAKYFTLNPHQYEASIFLVNANFWDSLSADDQAIMDEAMDETAEYYKEISQDMFDQYIEKCEAAGVTFNEVEDPEAWQEAVAPLYEKYGEGVEDIIQEIIDMR